MFGEGTRGWGPLASVDFSVLGVQRDLLVVCSCAVHGLVSFGGQGPVVPLG